MHGFRLSLLTAVGILAVASLGFADRIDITINGKDIVSATETATGTTTNISLTPILSNAAAYTYFDFAAGFSPSPLPAPLAWDDPDGGFDLVTFYASGFSVQTLTPASLVPTGAVYEGQGAPGDVITDRPLTITLYDKADSPNPVPEPATVTLLGLGLSGLAFKLRKRKT